MTVWHSVVVAALGLCIGMSGQRRPILLDYDLEGAVVRARERAGLKHEALAALMGISASQLSQQIGRRGGYLSLPRLLSVATDDDGRAFLRYLWADVGAFLGLDPSAAALQLQLFAERFQLLIDRVQVRMLSAQIDQPTEQKNRTVS